MELEAVPLVLQILEVEVYSLEGYRAKVNCFVKTKTNCNCLKVCFQIYLAMKIYVVYCYGTPSRGSISLSISVIHYVGFNVYFDRFL